MSSTSSTSSTSRMRHIVMWDVSGDTPQEQQRNAQKLKAGFESLLGRIPGLLTLEVGIDSSHVDYACHTVLVSEFESQAALDAYAVHPEHLRVKAEIGNMRTSRHQVDYPV